MKPRATPPADRAPTTTVPNSKQLKHELLPSRHSKATITGGDPFARSLGNYAKISPADVSGEKTAGLNITSMSRF